ncbi:MAG: hypothetical protein WCK63_14115 [Betaproteobacteria bacterium]
MKLDLSDLPKLQFSLIAAVLLIAVGAGTVHFFLDANRAALQARSAAQSERNEFDGKLKRVRTEENEIRDKSAVFSMLQMRGFIGDEQRLEWIELLKDIRDKRRLIDLEYDVAPQRPLDPTPVSAYSFFVSSMKIQLKLLHEEDLTRLLDDLRLQARALVQVRYCNVSRLPRGTPEPGSPALLQAECQIEWITLRDATGK